ncbi:MAG: hypothetical protein NTZ80_03780 [Patescibacteria group bacterium]|nr:hypothetical protein [Patescibacteria group bacterium]
MKDQFQTFVFEKYELDRKNNQVSLYYALDDAEHFCEKFYFPDGFFAENPQDEKATNKALFLLHLIAGVSYWKTAAPKKMIVNSGIVTHDLQRFCELLYKQGMSEFHYKNRIEDWAERAKFTISENSPISDEPIDMQESQNPKILLPLGGGKDSIVSALLLKKAGFDFTTFAAKPEKPIIDTSAVLQKELLGIRREIDPKLLELNQKDGLNGHVPISAIISALAVLTAVEKNYTHIIFSNERTASTNNLVWKDLPINHQWSKSFEFEKIFADLVRKEVRPDIFYFSLLRPFSEYHISKIFVENAQDFWRIFASCNNNFKLDPAKRSTGWCGKCAKCAFVFAMLSAWIEIPKVAELFGSNPFLDDNLSQLWRELLGIGDHKPFDCVGEPIEVACAIGNATEREGESLNETAITAIFEEFLMANPNFDLKQTQKELLTISNEHLIPQEISNCILSELQKS